ncbi:MAG: hypothetical protein IH978_08900 [Nitrospinae bacterium]|nr:hypothetical protein [Nitrospinota bacterium]
MTAHKRTIIFGILGILGILGFLGIGILALGMLTGSVALAERLHSSTVKGAAKVDPDTPNLTSLNIRLSHQPIQAPKNLVKLSVELPQVRAARSMIAPSPKAAILEDDNHNRVVILSASEDGQIHAQVLEDLDFLAKIPFITACADHRGCAFNRQPVTGGLACVAICVQQALDPSHELTP